MDDSSYSPSEHSSEAIIEKSQVSLRPVGSQMSISSAGSVQPISTTQKRRAKIFGAKSNRGKRRYSKLKKSKVAPMKTPESIQPELRNEEKFTPAETPACNSNIVMNLVQFQQVLDSMAKCSRCDGRLELAETGKSSGCASYLSLKCHKCDSCRKFWSVSGHSKGKLSIGCSQIPKRNSMVFCSVLAGRLMGVGWQKLHLYHSILNIPGPASSRNFRIVQADILVAANATAIESMLNARDQIRSIMNIDATCEFVSTVGTFDGAYQQRSGKSGGGFSRYCFAAAIIAQTGKVISYYIGCNSCAMCTRINNRYLCQSITQEEFDIQKELHKPVCPAEYSDLSSVHLESAIAPKVISDALERALFSPELSLMEIIRPMKH